MNHKEEAKVYIRENYAQVAQSGAAGYVIGVDMTPEMIKLARNNAAKSGYTNMAFRLGEIEHLPVADSEYVRKIRAMMEEVGF